MTRLTSGGLYSDRLLAWHHRDEACCSCPAGRFVEAPPSAHLLFCGGRARRRGDLAPAGPSLARRPPTPGEAPPRADLLDAEPKPDLQGDIPGEGPPRD